MTPRGRVLIVNADDFGQSPGVNRGVVRAHEEGIVTSASLMVRWPAAAEAAAYARAHPDLSLGLHVDLGEWAYREGRWIPLYQVVPGADVTAVANEAYRQLEWYRRLVGREPTHVDSHQHAHRSEPLRSVARDIAARLAVPLRHESRHVQYCGRFYGQTGRGDLLPGAISVERFLEILDAMPPGVTELSCHPGDGHDLDTMYARERAEEVSVLCDPRVRAAILARGIALRSFAEVSGVSGDAASVGGGPDRHG